MQISRLVKTLLLAVLVLCVCIEGQNFSGTNCFNSSTGQYNCNNQGYQGFFVNTSQNSNLNTVLCYAGATNCWYQGNSTTSGVTLYILCNYTFSGCSQCSNVSCTQCYNGYYQFQYNIEYSYANCQSCGTIAGCQLCTSQGGCNQCAEPYLNYLGSCYTQAGNPVSGHNYLGGGSTAAEIVLNCLVFLILIAVFYAFCFLFICKKSIGQGDVPYLRHSEMKGPMDSSR